jgi:putative colanic acid biosynthesis acetyltransferase WcaF
MNLGEFRNQDFDRGASCAREFLWLTLRAWLFDRSVMPWYRLRRAVLRGFGARVGEGVIVKPQVKITFPWKLAVGDRAWLGEEAWIMNLAPVEIGRDVCLSQRAFLCTGSHDWSDPAFKLVTAPITVRDGAWICANAFVGPGVTIGERAVVTAGSVVTHDLPADMVCAGNPCEAVKPRRLRDSARP